MITNVENEPKVKINKREKIETPSAMIIHRFKKNKVAVFGLVIFAILVLATVFAPILTPYGVDQMDYTHVNLAPSAQHWLGTDELGRDYLTRMLYGGRVSLTVGLFAVFISVVIGALVGGASGYYGGFVDNILMRFTEVVMSFPFLPLAITISAVVGTAVPSEYKIFITISVIGIIGWTGLARMIRGQILSLREQEFMEAATALGLSDRRKILKHLLPNTIGFIIVSATLGMAGAIMTESALSFLGLGVTPPTPSWGNMVQYARDFFVLKNRPWLWMPPGIAILLAVMSINLVGDGLRDAFDPKSR
ncbi:oligopeptide ABC transporter permease [Helicovermis profundi]|uniref:ABC transporter permease subunit n=1 Tax=Helicovermis profundi TaxID=3065157 RepID=A0AAU9EJF8_9FIRM|nr:ABC transporter permease subunit [Clostridia bacterium S502]